MTPEQFQQELNRLAKEFKELYNVHAPIIAANVAVSYFKKNFQNEAWGRVKWQEVKILSQKVCKTQSLLFL